MYINANRNLKHVVRKLNDMKKLLLATHNPAKEMELRIAFNPLERKGIRIESLKTLKITDEPDETGSTFEENSLLKARYFAQLSNLPTVGDDGGLIISALNNEPGVKSRRWLGRVSTDKELMDYTLKRLDGFPKEKRTAFLVACLCFYDPQTKKTIYQHEEVRGYIGFKPSINLIEGYPFRSLFIVDRYDKYYDELIEQEHDAINHRIIAARKLLKKIENSL